MKQNRRLPREYGEHYRLELTMATSLVVSRAFISSSPSSAPHDFSSLLPKSSFERPRSSCFSGWLYLATSLDLVRQYCRKLVFLVRKVQSRFLRVQLPIL